MHTIVIQQSYIFIIDDTREDIKGEMLHCKMAILQEEMCRGRHQGDAGEESQGFRVVKVPEVEGMDKIATGNGIVELVGYDEYMSLGLGSVGEELIEEKQMFKVVQDHQQGELHLVQGGLDLASNVVGKFVVVWQERGECITAGCCPDARWQHCIFRSWGEVGGMTSQG